MIFGYYFQTDKVFEYQREDPYECSTMDANILSLKERRDNKDRQ